MDDQNVIKIEATEESPEIVLDANNSLLKITGASFPEDAYETYSPVLKWLDDVGSDLIKLTCEFEFSLLSSASNKLLFEILYKLEDLFNQNKDVIVFWYHDDYDEDMQEEGEGFAQTVNIPFKFIAT